MLSFFLSSHLFDVSIPILSPLSLFLSPLQHVPFRPGDELHLVHVIPRLQLAAVYGAPPVDFLPQQVRFFRCFFSLSSFFFFFSLSMPSTTSRPSPSHQKKKKKIPGPGRVRAAHQERRALRLPAFSPSPPVGPSRPGRPPRQGRGRRRLYRQRRLPEGQGPGSGRFSDGLAHQIEAPGVFPRERDQLLLPPLLCARARRQVKMRERARESKRERDEVEKLFPFFFKPSVVLQKK